jgi:hypothetical protein
MAAFFGGVGWVAGTPHVWPRAMVPGATALVLVAALAVGSVRGALAFAHRTLGNGFGAGLLGVLLAVAGVVLAIVVGVSLAQPLSGWALDGIVRARVGSHSRFRGVSGCRCPKTVTNRSVRYKARTLLSIFNAHLVARRPLAHASAPACQ